MAKLPEYQSSRPLTRNPQSSVSPAEIDAPFNKFAAAVGNLAEGFHQRDVVKAGQDGADGVYRDANGVLQVDRRNDLSETGRRYNASAEQRYEALVQAEIKTSLDKMRIDANGNVDAFRAEYDGYRNRMISTAPANARGMLTQLFDVEGPRISLGISEEKRQSDLQKTVSGTKATLDMLEGDAAALAFSGGTDTPAYKSTLERIRSLTTQMAENPDLKFSPEEADVRLKQIEGRNRSEAIVGMAQRAIETGGLAEAEKFRDTLINDPDLHMDPGTRRQYAGMVDGMINSHVAGIKADQKVLIDESDEMQKGIEAGTIKPDDPKVLDMATRLSGAYAGGEAFELLRTARVAANNNSPLEMKIARAENTAANINRPAATRNRPVSLTKDVTGRMEQAYAHLKARGLPDVAVAGIVGNLVHESRLNTGAINPGDGTDGTDSIGIAQWNSGRAKALKAFAAERGTDPSDFATQLDFVVHELETSERDSYQRLLAATTVDEAAAAFAGYERPQGWSVANPRNSHGWHSRLSSAVKAGQMAGLSPQLLASTTGYVDPVEAAAYQKQVTDGVRDMKPGFEAMIKSGTPIDSQSFNLMSRSLAIVDDQGLRNDMAGLLRSDEALRAMKDVPPQDVARLIDQLENATPAEGMSIAQYQFAEGVKAQAARQVEAIAKNPIGYGSDAGIVPRQPVFDASAPDTWTPTFQSYQAAANKMRAWGDLPPISALPPATQQAVANVVVEGDPQQMAALTQSLSSSLNPETLRATLTQDGDFKQALKGAVLSIDPAKFSTGMQQLDLLISRGGMSFDEIQTEFGEQAVDRLQDWRSMVRYYNADQMQDWLKERSDPRWQATIAPRVKKGEDKAREYSVDQIVKLVSPTWFGKVGYGPVAALDPATSREVQNDFVQVFGQRMGSLNDEGAALKDTVARFQKKWGVTSAFGNYRGRFMSNPPENYYPQINGTHQYIADELAAVAGARGAQVEDMNLVPDAQTMADIQSGKPPGYQITYRDKETGNFEVMRDQQGRPQRMRFDTEAAQRKADADAAEARRTEYDPWMVLGPDTAIGPFYGLDGATPGENERTLQRTREIWEQQQNPDAGIDGMPYPESEMRRLGYPTTGGQ